MLGTGWFFWVRATYFDHSIPPKPQQAFSGYWLNEADAYQWATKHYAQMPGATFEVIRSKSRQRDIARCEKRTGMLDDGEGDVAEVLNVRFRDQNKKGAE